MQLNSRSIYNYGINSVRSRIKDLAPSSGTLTVLPLFASRSYFMKPWLETHPIIDAYNTFMDGVQGYNADVGSWKNHINIGGYHWYRYTDLSEVPGLKYADIFDYDVEKFLLHSGDLSGNGNNEYFLQRKLPGGPSYILNIYGELEQTIQEGFLNIDWSAASYSAQITSGNIVLTPSTPHKYAFEGQPYSFSPSTTANASSNVTYSATGMPGWMSLNTSTGEINGTPAIGDIDQSHQIVITVSKENNTQIVDHVLLSLNVNVVKPFAISQTAYTVYEATDGALYLVSDNGVDVYKVVDDNGADVILKITTDEFNIANVGLEINHHAFIKDFDNDGTLDLVLESLVNTQPRVVIRNLAGNVHTITRGDTLSSISEEEPIITQIGNFDTLKLGENGVSGWAYDPSDPSSPIDVRLYVNDSNDEYTTVAANKPRPDINELGIPDDHGFAFTIPSGIVTNITAKVEARAVMLDGTETSIGTRYFITVKTGRAHTMLTAETVLASTNETVEKVSLSTNENGDFTAWNLPAGETYSVRASTTDFDVCFEPSQHLVTTTGVINDGDVTFTEITCPTPANLRDELIKAWGPISWEREPGVTAVNGPGPNFNSWLNSVLLFAATTGYKIKAIPNPFGHRGLDHDGKKAIFGGYGFRSYFTLILIFHDEQGYAQATGWYSRYLDDNEGKPFSGIAPFIPRIPVEPGTAGTAVLPLRAQLTNVAQVDSDLFRTLPLLEIAPEARLPVKWDVLAKDGAGAPAQPGTNPITSPNDANAIENKLYENLTPPNFNRNVPLETTRELAWESAIANFHFGEKGCSRESYRCEVFRTFPSSSNKFRTLRVRIPWPGKVTDDNVNVDWVRFNESSSPLQTAYNITTSIFEGTVLSLTTSSLISGLTSEITTALPQALRYRAAIDLVLTNIITDGVDPEVALKAGFRRALGIGVGSVLDGVVRTTSGAVTINGQSLGKRIPFLAQLNFEDNFRLPLGFNVADGFQITQEGLEVDVKNQLNKLIGSDMLNLLSEAGVGPDKDSRFISSLKENVREFVTDKATESFSTQQAGISKSLDILLVTSTKNSGVNENIPECVPSDPVIEDEIECLFAAIVVGTEDEFRVSDLTPQDTDILRISAPDIVKPDNTGPFDFIISLPHFATDAAGLNVVPEDLIFTAFVDGKEVKDTNPADTLSVSLRVDPDEVRMAGTHYLQVQVHTKDGNLKGDLVAESARLWFYLNRPILGPTTAIPFHYIEGSAIANKVSE